MFMSTSNTAEVEHCDSCLIIFLFIYVQMICRDGKVWLRVVHAANPDYCTIRVILKL